MYIPDADFSNMQAALNTKYTGNMLACDTFGSRGIKYCSLRGACDTVDTSGLELNINFFDANGQNTETV